MLSAPFLQLYRIALYKCTVVYSRSGRTLVSWSYLYMYLLLLSSRSPRPTTMASSHGPAIARGALESALAASLCLALGHALEVIASQRRLGLHLIPLGPGSGADVTAPPLPFGEHGWLPLPLGVLGMGLLWNGNIAWRADSWWGRCYGPLWGQLPSLAVSYLGVLPSLLAAWLLWQPRECSPLPSLLAMLVACTSITSLLFWSDNLPLLPRAGATAESSRLALRRALLCLMHVGIHAVGTWRHATAHGDGAAGGVMGSDGETADASSAACWLATGEAGCAAMLGRLGTADGRGFVWEELMAQMRAQTPQGMMAPGQLVMQTLVACYAIFIVIDAPSGSGGRLWGARD